MTVELEEFFEKAKKSEEFVYGPRNINTETAEGRKRALMRSDPYEWVRAGWVEQPDLYSVEAAREMCEEEAYQAAVRDECAEHAIYCMRGQLIHDFPQEVIDQFTPAYMEGLAWDARNERAAECGGTILTIWDYLEQWDEERPEERSGHRFILGPREGELHGIFALGSLHLVQGSSGAGKTSVGLNLLRAQEKGESYFGRAGRGRSYLVVWQDRSEDELRRQLEMLGMEKDPPPYVVVTAKQGNMEPAKALEEILAAQKTVPEVLFVEGLDMWVPDAKDMKWVANAATNVRAVGEKYHCAIVATVGMPKMKPKERYTAPRDRAFGSSAWARKADTVVDITVDEEDHPKWGQIRHVQILSRTARVQKVELGFDKEGKLVVIEPAIVVGPAPEVPTLREIMQEHKCGWDKAREIRDTLESARRGRKRPKADAS